MPGKIKDVGPIANVSSSGGRLWQGGISLKNRFGELGKEKIQEALDSIGKFFVATDDGAASTCVDGRPIEGWDKSAELQERPLGPKTPGGTAHTALANSIMEAGSSSQGKTFVEDFEKMIKRYKERGLLFGGHIDDHQHGANTGCGAIDKIPEIFEKMFESGFSETIRPYLKAVLGKDYEDALVDSLLARAKKLHEREHEYFEKESGQYAYKQKVIDSLQTNGHGKKVVEKLVGGHREIALVINHAPKTTFDRDAFSAAHDHEMQAFDYDFWRTRAVAKELYLGSRSKQKEFLTMRAMLAIPTIMVLTDGSIHLLVRNK